MDSEDSSDTREDDYGPYPELTKRVFLWSGSIESVTRRKSLESTGKVYFYSPIIFGKSYFTGYWSEAVTGRLLTNMRFDMVPTNAATFLTQMDILERTYLTVWGTLKEFCDTQREDQVASLMHFTNHCEHEDSIELILEEASGDPLFATIRSHLSNTEISKIILLLCLKYYFYILEMVVVKRKDPEKALSDHPKKTLKKIEELKVKGNALFQSNRYRKAIKYYTDAIKIDRYNPVLYCNRAQANLYLDENWEALLDAKRAILLNPTWPKAYYRFSQALFELEYTKRAIDENRRGQRVCGQGDHDIKDLQSQLNRMLAEKDRIETMEKIGSMCLPSSLDFLDYDSDESISDTEDQVPVKPILEDTYMEMFDGNRRFRIDTPATLKKNGEDAMRRLQDKERKERERQEKEVEAKKAKEKKREKDKQTRIANEEERKRKMREEENNRNKLTKKEKKKKLTSDRDFYLKKGSTALVEGRARQAYEDYGKAEEVMEESPGKYGSLTEGGRVIFLYAQGMAALETANPQLFPVAMDKFDAILTNHTTIRTALPYYGKAKTLFYMNRFQEALTHIENGCTIADGFATSVETWPGLNKNIGETESASKMLKSLKDLKDQCLNPRPPEAVCRNPECESTSIYFNDIEFEGFVKVHCSDHCKMDYHIECWRKLRSTVKKKTDKDMLDSECFTPDCSGLIQDVATYGGDALIKSRIAKKEAPHEKVKTVKAVSKQVKKDKKGKKVKPKERTHKEEHTQDEEMVHADEYTVEELHPVDIPTEPMVEPPKAEPAVTSIEVEPLDEPTCFEDDEADTAMLHLEPAYIIKRDLNPDQVEEKKPPPKPSKSKNKKKKGVIPLEQRFYDQDNRYLMTAEDAPAPPPDDLCLGYQSGASNQNSWLQKPPPILLTEEEKSYVLVSQIHFLEILENNGPLKINNPILVEEVKRLPIDSQELINRHGGLASFLCVSEDFAMVENYVCRHCDLAKCRSIVDHQKVVWTPLPQPGAPPNAHRQSSRGENRSPWVTNQYGVDRVDSASSQEPENRMNSLDTFEYSDSDGDVESSDSEDEEEDSSPSGEHESSPPETPSRSDPASPPWTPSRSTVITADFDGELDKLISGEHLVVGDAFSGEAQDGIDSQGNGGYIGNLAAVDSLVDVSKVCDGFDGKPIVDADNFPGFLSHRLITDQQWSTGVVDSSDGKRVAGKVQSEDTSAGVRSDSILYGKGDDVNVFKPDVGTKESTDSVDGTATDHTADATGDNNKHVVGGNVAGETPKVSPGRALSEDKDTLSLQSTTSVGGGAQIGMDLVSGVKKIIDGGLSSYDASGRGILVAGPSVLGGSDTLVGPGTIVDGHGPTLDTQTADLDAGSSTLDDRIDAILDKQINAVLEAQGKTLDTQTVVDLDGEFSNVKEKFVTEGDHLVVGGTGASEASGVDDSSSVGNGIDIRSSLEKLNQNDVVMRCNSGEQILSGSSGISLSPTQSVSMAALQEKMTRFAESVRTVLGLHPGLKGNEEDDEILMTLLNDKFYRYVEDLKEASVKPEQKSVGTAAKVGVAVKWSNTDPFTTYEKQYQQAERKCENLEIALRDSFSEYKSLENVLAVTQNEKFKQNVIIEDLQRELRLTDEKLKKEITMVQGEKANLLMMVHGLEGKARATQATLQEYGTAKEILNQTKSERDNLKKVQTELEQKVEELRQECQKQEQRAKKSEVSIVQIHKEQALKPLTEAMKECDFHVRNLNQVLTREPNANLTIILNDWERCLEENKQKLETTTTQFDTQIMQLQSGMVLTDLPVIPRPEPSRSKSLKSNPGPPWPHFGGPPPPYPPPRFPVFNGPAPPFRPPGAMPIPPGMPPQGMPPRPQQQGMPQQPQPMPPQSTSPKGQPSTSSPLSSTPNSTPPLSASPLPRPPAQMPAASTHLPPARGAGSALPAGPGTTMPLAPGPGDPLPPTSWHLAQQPIGTRNAGAYGGMVNGGAAARETDSPVTAQGEATAPAAKSSAGPPKKPPAAQGLPAPHQGQAARVGAGSHQAPAAQGGGQQRSSYQRIMDRLGSKFPSYNKIQLTNFLRIVRVNNGNSLSGLSMDGITQKVEELVADAQAKIPLKQFPGGDGPGVSRITPLAKIPAAPSQNPWSSVDEPTSGSGWSTGEVYNDEVDPCVICHEEMTLKEVLDLECGHRFHADCIQEWLGTKSTCPNCRKFTKLKQDFPPLM